MNIIRDALWLMTLCLCGCGLTMAGSVSYTLTPDLSSFSLVDVKGGDGNDYTRIVWPDTYVSMEEGGPELPIYDITFLVPTYSTDFSVKVTGYDGMKKEITNLILPVQKPLTLSRTRHNTPFISGLDELYSSRVCEIHGTVVDDQIMAGRYHTVTVRITLCSYDTEASLLTLYQTISVSLDYRECNTEDMPLATDISRPYVLMYPLAQIVVNPDDETKMLQPIHSSRYTSTSTTPQDEYLIIAPSEMCSAFNELKLWKQQKGLTLSIIPIEEVYHEFVPNPNHPEIKDKAASLRAYLRSRYQTCSGELYVLLAGNPALTDMPIRYQFGENNKTDKWHTDCNTENFIPSDNYFQNVTQSWQLDPHEAPINFAVPNLSTWYAPEIIIGRLLCNNTQDILNYTEKLILYEAFPGRGDMEYLHHAFAFEQDYSGQLCSMLTDANKVLTLLKDKFIPTCFKDEGKSSTPRNWPQGPDVIQQMRNNGYNSWHGHGNPAYIATCSGIPDQNVSEYNLWYGICALEAYSSADRYGSGGCLLKRTGEGLDNLNNAGYPSIVYSMSCTNAPPDFYNDRDELGNTEFLFGIPYNLAASFTLGAGYGGPAFLGNSRVGHKPASSNLEVSFIRCIADNPCIGKAENQSKLTKTGGFTNWERHAHYLNGDPEFNMWYGMPFSPAIAGTPISTQKFNISCGGLPSMKIFQFDGQGHSVTHHASTTNLELSSQETRNGFKPSPLIAFGVWRNDCLPAISLRNCPGNLNEGSYSYIVKDAILGLETNSIGITQAALEISKNTQLSIKALDKIYFGKNMEISGSAVIKAYSEGSAELGECKLTGNSLCSITASTISISEGFSIDAGAILDISPL